jgi:UDPglucose 6-dehydrogenase
MKITIAGYGTTGQYVEGVFGACHEVTVYDPPKRLGDAADLRDADYVFVCVPTPSLPGGACDTSLVEAVVRLAEPRIAIVCESTVAIGTTQRLIDATGKSIVFVPEYAGESPSHPYRDPRAREFFIYGGYDPAASRVRDLFVTVYPLDAAHTIVDPTTAETVKYMENAFLALKVAFCNEIYDLCERTGADYETARRVWAQDWRIGDSHSVVTAERGFAGACLPKDVDALITTARDAGASLEVMEAARRSNARVRAVAAVAAGAGPATPARPA